MSWLQNSWMDNTVFLAEMAHFAWAYGILLTAALWSATRRQLMQLFLAFLAFALLKEFWYDLQYELPADTLAGSTLDFVVYSLGGLVALAVVGIRRRIEQRRALARLQEQLLTARLNEQAFMTICRDINGNPFPGYKPRLYSPEDN